MILKIRFNKIEFVDVFDCINEWNNCVPVTIVEMNLVIFIFQSAQEMLVALHGASRIRMVSDVLSLNRSVITQGPFHF
jgi:hypothetical protein